MMTQNSRPKKKKTLLLGLLFSLIALSVAVGALKLHQNKDQRYNYALAQKGDIKETVSVTGRVKPASEIGLAFEKSGKVARVFVRVGDVVKQGETLIKLRADDIVSQLNQAKAQLSFQKAKLQELESGASPEKRELSRVKMMNAEENLRDTQQQLQQVQAEADASINKICHTSVEDALKSLNVARASLLTLTDLQYKYFSGFSQEDINLAEAKEKAISQLFGKNSCGRCVADVVASLDGGLENQFKLLQSQNNLTSGSVSPLLSSLLSALKKVKTALDMVQVSKLTSSELASLDTAKTNIYTETISNTANQQSINLQEKTNENTLTTYQNKVKSAENSLMTAKKELSLTEAPPTQDEINAQRAQIKQAEAQIVYYQAQLAKTVIRSPLDGIVTAVDIKEGEIALPQQIIIKLISRGKFQIEADIAETDIPNIKIGQKAEVTLDAYGDNVKFMARVIKIDPAEKMIEGIATYKTTFQFIDQTADIKPGMTANLDILVKQKKGVLIIPQRAVIRQEKGEFVRILDQNNKLQKVKVTTGIRGDDGNIEIIKGLKEGDKVITFIKTP